MEEPSEPAESPPAETSTVPAPAEIPEDLVEEGPRMSNAVPSEAQPRMSQAVESPRISQDHGDEPQEQEPRKSNVREVRLSQPEEEIIDLPRDEEAQLAVEEDKRLSDAQEPRMSQVQEPRRSQQQRQSQLQEPRLSQMQEQRMSRAQSQRPSQQQRFSEVIEQEIRKSHVEPLGESEARGSVVPEKSKDELGMSSLIDLNKVPFIRRQVIDRTALIEELVQTYTQTRNSIQQKIEVLECLDIAITVAAFKLFEATSEFKEKIAEVKKERWQLLTSLSHKSELSLILHDLDKKISDYERELDAKTIFLNQQKISHQEDMESLLPELDADFAILKDVFEKVEDAVNDTLGTNYRGQVAQVNDEYAEMLEQYDTEIETFQKLQLSSWKVEHSEVKLAEILEEQGLKFTPSGRLLTRQGSRITFQEAQEKGYLKNIQVPIERFLAFVNPSEPSSRSETAASSAMTFQDRMTSEEVKYLKETVGKVLTLALSEITTKQPRDPIHYLGHYLFKYRYNQELEEVQKLEVEELTKRRDELSKERWHKFIEEEARHAVVQMVIRAEEIALMNELRRIEEEQKRAEMEEEEMDAVLMEEARDKFE